MCIRDRIRPQKDYALIGGYDMDAGLYKLWRINVDGSGFTYLVDVPGEVYRVEWLEDGGKALVLTSTGLYEYNPADNTLNLKNEGLNRPYYDFRRHVGNTFFITGFDYPYNKLLMYDYNTNEAEVIGQLNSGWVAGRIVIRSNPFMLCYLSVKSYPPDSGVYVNVYDGSSLSAVRFRGYAEYYVSGSLCDWDAGGGYLYLILGIWAGEEPYLRSEVWRMSVDGGFMKVYEEVDNPGVFINWGCRVPGVDRFLAVNGGLVFGGPGQLASYMVYWDNTWVYVFDEAEPTSWICREVDVV